MRTLFEGQEVEMIEAWGKSESSEIIFRQQRKLSKIAV